MCIETEKNSSRWRQREKQKANDVLMDCMTMKKAWAWKKNVHFQKAGIVMKVWARNEKSHIYIVISNIAVKRQIKADRWDSPVIFSLLHLFMSTWEKKGSSHWSANSPLKNKVVKHYYTEVQPQWIAFLILLSIEVEYKLTYIYTSIKTNAAHSPSLLFNN